MAHARAIELSVGLFRSREKEKIGVVRFGQGEFWPERVLFDQDEF